MKAFVVTITVIYAAALGGHILDLRADSAKRTSPQVLFVIAVTAAMLCWGIYVLVNN